MLLYFSFFLGLYFYSLTFFLLFLYLFLALGLAFGHLDLGLGLEDLGVFFIYHLFFCVFWNGVCIFFLPFLACLFFLFLFMRWSSILGGGLVCRVVQMHG